MNVTELLELMRRLRDRENGCPWDREQTFASIAPYTVEEAYEVEDAIQRNDLDDLKNELGDLLFQVVFHAEMAKEQGAFTFEDVVHGLVEKMTDGTRTCSAIPKCATQNIRPSRGKT